MTFHLYLGYTKGDTPDPCIGNLVESWSGYIVPFCRGLLGSAGLGAGTPRRGGIAASTWPGARESITSSEVNEGPSFIPVDLP